MTSPSLPSGADGYDTGIGYDEGFEAPGRPRPAYADLMTHLAGADLAVLAERIEEQLVQGEVTFGGADGHPFLLDAVPRILTRHEWDEISAGLRQRVRALDLFLDDVYGERRTVAEGIVPEHVVTGSAYLEQDVMGARPAGGARVALAGLDLVRDENGRFLVLEDNLRTPSGIAYAMAASDVLADLVPLRSPSAGAREELAGALRSALEASAPDVEGELVLLTDGPGNSAYYEHRRLAEIVGLELAERHDLRRRGDHVELQDGRRVRSVYRRTDDDGVRDQDGRLTATAELLLAPLLAGQVGMVNWFGNGVADDKHVYAYVDDLVRFFLDEEPTVPSVPTYDLTDEQRREEVLDRLEELVVKPRGGLGGQGVVVGPAASREEIDEARKAVRADPAGWIAQEAVTLSTHPTVVDGRLVPRHVDLRPFAVYDGQRVVVPSGGLTRVALAEGSMVVNSSRDGGGKATWVLD